MSIFRLPPALIPLLVILLGCLGSLHGQDLLNDGPSAQRPCIDHRETAEMEARIAANRSRLLREGKLTSRTAAARAVPQVLFRWPLYPTAAFKDFSYYRITNYVDQDPDEDEVLDYNCGNRTYDGHNGIDIALRPFPWNMMADEVIDVVAAADGVIVDKVDGNYDLNCDWDDPPPSNKIVLEHADGTRSYYLHLKKWSLTAKDIGDEVVGGEYLAKVGSSGRSTGPHLHFEVHDADDNVQEPFAGSCNDKNDNSYWIFQLPYYNPTVLRLGTFSDQPEEPDCQQAQEFEKNSFTSGESVTFGVFLRDLNNGDQLTLQILDPSGVQKWQWSENWNSGYRNFKSFYYETQFTNHDAGLWKMRATFAGQVFERTFTVVCTPSYQLSGTHSGTVWRIARDYITSTATISGQASNNVNYRANDYIRLLPGFHAEAGSTFTAVLDGCQNASLPESAGIVAGETENALELQVESGTLPEVGNWAKLYPTLASTEVWLDLRPPGGESGTVMIFDGRGQTAYRNTFEQADAGSTFQLRIDCAGWPPGMYRVLVQTAGQQTVLSMLKQ